MGVDLRAQALSLGLACALGMGLGLLYDLLRPFRRLSGDPVWDILFCFCAALSAFLFAMRAPDGVFGTGEMLLCLAGLLLWFHALSPSLFPVFGIFERAIGAIWIFTQNSGKKVLFSAKKLFQKPKE